MGEEIVGPKSGCELRRQSGQRVVAGDEPAGVIDRFESVDIEREDGDAAAGAGRRLERIVEGLEQLATAGKPGQVVERHRVVDIADECRCSGLVAHHDDSDKALRPLAGATDLAKDGG